MSQEHEECGDTTIGQDSVQEGAGAAHTLTGLQNSEENSATTTAVDNHRSKVESGEQLVCRF